MFQKNRYQNGIRVQMFTWYHIFSLNENIIFSRVSELVIIKLN